MKKTENTNHIEGYVYEHELNLKVSGPNSKNPGVSFINGELKVATDDELTNIVPIHFSYVTATTKNGNPNATYTALKAIIDGNVSTVMKAGKNNAGMVRIDSTVGVNDFYTNNDGKVELVSAMRSEGGFVHVCNALSEDLKKRNQFKCDILITNVSRTEGNEETGTKDKVTVKGYIFDFRNAFYPATFVTYDEAAMNYYESLEVNPKNPVFTKLWGNQVATTIKKEIKTDSAFGEAYVKEVTNTRKEFVISGGQLEPYAYDDESTITEAEVAKGLADREVHLAEVKAAYEEYMASKAQVGRPVATPAPSTDSQGFNF